MMSSTDALEMLKNWQRAATPLLLSSVSLNGKMFEVRAVVSAVSESAVVLSNMDSPDQTEVVELGGVTFAETPLPGLQLTYSDGKKTVLREN
jgi:hypothetical protein